MIGLFFTLKEEEETLGAAPSEGVCVLHKAFRVYHSTNTSKGVLQKNGSGNSDCSRSARPGPVQPGPARPGGRDDDTSSSKRTAADPHFWSFHPCFSPCAVCAQGSLPARPSGSISQNTIIIILVSEQIKKKKIYI